MPQDKSGKLVVVGTPIGNMGDISPRAVEALSQADTVCAEDTRVAGKLLAQLGIKTRIERCDENVIAQRAAGLAQRIEQGEVIAFVSDAGMPGVSDPGAVLVDACREAGVAVDVVPGPTAVSTALISSGFATSAYYFGGFLPRKARACEELLVSLAKLPAALVFYESPHRTAGSLASVANVFPSRRVCMARELTKLHQEVVCDTAPRLAEQVAARGDLKGEVVLVIAPPTADEGRTELDPEAVRARAEELYAQGVSPSRAAKTIAQEMGVSKNAVYDLLVG